MIIFEFLIFFALNFSLWYMFPCFLLKSLTKISKRKNKGIRNDIIIYLAITGIYILIYTMFYRYFNIAILELGEVEGIGYFVNNIHNITAVSIVFCVVSIIYSAYTYYLAKRNFKHEHVRYGYLVVSITGLLNIITYFLNYSILNLSNYSYLAERGFLNLILKVDVDFLIFVFPLIVFSDFALSFIEEK